MCCLLSLCVLQGGSAKQVTAAVGQERKGIQPPHLHNSADSLNTAPSAAAPNKPYHRGSKQHTHGAFRLLQNFCTPFQRSSQLLFPSTKILFSAFASASAVDMSKHTKSTASHKIDPLAWWGSGGHTQILDVLGNQIHDEFRGGRLVDAILRVQRLRQKHVAKAGLEKILIYCPEVLC